jgi:hypothetical protein
MSKHFYGSNLHSVVISIDFVVYREREKERKRESLGEIQYGHDFAHYGFIRFAMYFKNIR